MSRNQASGLALRAGAATDVGLVRSNNQDQLLCADPLFAVADGMGGAAAGEVASAIAVEALARHFASAEVEGPDALRQATQAANRAVWEAALANPDRRGMGTTLVALALIDAEHLAVVNVGDSRLYLLRDGELRQVTADHNLVAELVAEGRISEEEAEMHPRRNIMTRALGVEPEVDVDLFIETPLAGDRYLLCSDGLSRELRDHQIASLLSRFADPTDAARELVEEAKRRGGNDNVTVVVVDLVDHKEVDGQDLEHTRALEVGTAETLPDAPPSPPAPPAPRRPQPERPRARLVTVRVVGFLLLLALVLGGGVAGIVWYARDSYFVGLEGNRIVIFQGRPGGVLWLEPTVSEVTAYDTSQVLPARLQDLRDGQQEPTLAAAVQYVNRLVSEYRSTRSPSGASPGASPSSTLAPLGGSTSTAPATTAAAAGGTS